MGKSMDADGGGVSVFATPSLHIPEGDKQHLLSVDENVDDENWNAQQTEQLERELENQITIEQYKQSRDEKLIDELDDEEAQPDTESNENIPTEKANLFRIESSRKKGWSAASLDGQANSMQEQMDRLAKQQSDERADET